MEKEEEEEELCSRKMEVSQPKGNLEDECSTIQVTLKRVVKDSFKRSSLGQAVQDVSILRRTACLAWSLWITERANDDIEYWRHGTLYTHKDLRRVFMWIFATLTTTTTYVKNSANKKRAVSVYSVRPARMNPRLFDICVSLRPENPISRGRLQPALENTALEMERDAMKDLGDNLFSRVSKLLRTSGLEGAALEEGMRAVRWVSSSYDGVSQDVMFIRKLLGETNKIQDVDKMGDGEGDDLSVASDLGPEEVQEQPVNSMRESSLRGDGRASLWCNESQEIDLDEDIMDLDYAPPPTKSREVEERHMADHELTHDDMRLFCPFEVTHSTRSRETRGLSMSHIRWEENEADETFLPRVGITDYRIQSSPNSSRVYYAVLHYVNCRLRHLADDTRANPVRPLGVGLGKPETACFVRFDDRALERLGMGKCVDELDLTGLRSGFGVPGCNSFSTNGYAASIPFRVRRVPTKNTYDIPRDAQIKCTLQSESPEHIDAILSMDPGNRDLFHGALLEPDGAYIARTHMSGGHWHRISGLHAHRQGSKGIQSDITWPSLKDCSTMEEYTEAIRERARLIPESIAYSMSNNSRKRKFNFRRRTMSALDKLPIDLANWIRSNGKDPDKTILAWGDYSNPGSSPISGRMPVRRVFKSLKRHFGDLALLACERRTSKNCPSLTCTEVEMTRGLVPAHCYARRDKTTESAVCCSCQFSVDSHEVFVKNRDHLSRRVCGDRKTRSWTLKHCPSCLRTYHRDFAGALGIGRRLIRRIQDMYSLRLGRGGASNSNDVQVLLTSSH